MALDLMTSTIISGLSINVRDTFRSARSVGKCLPAAGGLKERNYKHANTKLENIFKGVCALRGYFGPPMRQKK